jgi:DNA-binding NarL/FixJ family response regulator
MPAERVGSSPGGQGKAVAATGLTNREIAKVAFMSEKTVEAHVARVYGKLGIRSRAELGARMASNPEAAS